jgi:hypothetical protein
MTELLLATAIAVASESAVPEFFASRERELVLSTSGGLMIQAPPLLPATTPKASPIFNNTRVS